MSNVKRDARGRYTTEDTQYRRLARDNRGRWISPTRTTVNKNDEIKKIEEQVDNLLETLEHMKQ